MSSLPTLAPLTVNHTPATPTLSLAAALIVTVLLTVLLYVWIPKGFFPQQDTGVIQAITEAPQSISFSAMAERQHALGAKILEDPAVRSLSSFIGVDGTNATLNSGRMLINLLPHGERSETASEGRHVAFACLFGRSPRHVGYPTVPRFVRSRDLHATHDRSRSRSIMRPSE